MALPSLKATNALQGLCQSRKVKQVKGLGYSPPRAMQAKTAERQDNPAKDSH